MTTPVCPGCGGALAHDATCPSCGGEAVTPERAAAMRAALGALAHVGGWARRCAFCDGAMTRQRAVVLVIDVWTCNASTSTSSTP